MALKLKNISELRQDLVTEDWVVVAVGRLRRPHAKPGQRSSGRQSLKTCALRNIESPLVLYSLDGIRVRSRNGSYAWHPGPRHIWDKDWWVVVVPNKYPAFGKGVCILVRKAGPYQITDGVGFHEVVITRDHSRSIAQMSVEEVEMIIRAYQDRYLALKDDGCVEYVSIFHNHGSLAGASISHPHSQIIAIPVVPPDVGRSLRGTLKYFKDHRRCVHCVVIDHELKDKKRVVYLNDHFVVLAPFAPKSVFELRIFPKRHYPRFEEITPTLRVALADALRTALAKLHRVLNNPDYNFFLHTAPTAESNDFDHYHWHFEILPKVAIWAGFEIATGIEVSTVAPETAAQILRKVRV